MKYHISYLVFLLNVPNTYYTYKNAYVALTQCAKFISYPIFDLVLVSVDLSSIKFRSGMKTGDTS